MEPRLAMLNSWQGGLGKKQKQVHTVREDRSEPPTTEVLPPRASQAHSRYLSHNGLPLHTFNYPLAISKSEVFQETGPQVMNRGDPSAAQSL